MNYFHPVQFLFRLLTIFFLTITTSSLFFLLIFPPFSFVVYSLLFTLSFIPFTKSLIHLPFSFLITFSSMMLFSPATITSFRFLLGSLSFPFFQLYSSHFLSFTISRNLCRHFLLPFYSLVYSLVLYFFNSLFLPFPFCRNKKRRQHFAKYVIVQIN